MAPDIDSYIADLRRSLRAGNATEHTYRPALKHLIESFRSGLTAINEPRRIECGAPDLLITERGLPVGHIEAKDIGKPLDHEERTVQFKRYQEALTNLVLTDYLEFRWYVAGVKRLEARIEMGKGDSGHLGAQSVLDLLRAFLNAPIGTVRNSEELATRMAALARLTRDLIGRTLRAEHGTGSLHDQLAGFRRVLLHDLTPDQFADMYAQTICYGLFTARCVGSHHKHFTRERAAYDLPKTNPFLRQMFAHIAGPDLDERVSWAVDDIVRLLDRTDINATLRGFGEGSGRRDPVFHFYETFLAAYDPSLREGRGVYYTPQPVVSYIVRSVDALLRDRFSIADGLASSETVQLRLTPKARPQTIHKVLILDPAAGTGTFLHEVIDQIHNSFSGNQGLWPGYVSEHLLPRVFGFELLMAPYAVAHLKLGLQLASTGYDLDARDRLRIYLTNALEEAHEEARLPLFAQWLADEARAASEVKMETPVMVVLGNPPYSGESANNGRWITNLLRGYDSVSDGPTESYFHVDGQPLGERNPKWLNDDYVKFIRYAQWRIERTGHGILAFISNNGYLDNPTFRGMRQSLMRTFDGIYLLNLHGNANKREVTPEGNKDENVFEIRQGVAIGIFVRREKRSRKPCVVRYFDLWGLRGTEYPEEGQEPGKYGWLLSNDVSSTKWHTITPQAPLYLFVPQDESLLGEYERGWRIPDAMPVGSLGIATARDSLTICWTPQEAWERVNQFLELGTESARQAYALGPDSQDWKVELAQQDLKQTGPDRRRVIPILYRPFDTRYTYYTGSSRGFHCRPRGAVMRHLVSGGNMGLCITRGTEISGGFEHVLCSPSIIQLHTVSQKEVNYIHPLFVRKEDEPHGQMPLLSLQGSSTGEVPNFRDDFIRHVEEKVNLRFDPSSDHSHGTRFGPGDLFGYIYAILWSPAYRSRYSEFLKSDFPRVPIAGNQNIFRALAAIGEELASLHSMRRRPTGACATFPTKGTSRVEIISYDDESGQVWINDRQSFTGVEPAVWSFRIGGYQVCERWLKDRKGLELGYQDLQHYSLITGVLADTIRLMEAVDAAIPRWPLA